jgi:2-oxoglutarate ferredoxin oxidoreductase subunit beta
MAESGFRSELKPVWCEGCGNFAALDALAKALETTKPRPQDVVLVAGIGCGSRLPGYLKSFRLHTVHGRALPAALGAKVANPALTVIAVGGDGDGLAIGGNHFLHTLKRNPQILYVMTDNGVYGMTRGQASPTAGPGLVSKSTPYGSIETPVDPAALAITVGATFVARGFSGNPRQLRQIVLNAMLHKGFSFVQVLSPCVTFHNTYPELKQNAKEVPAEHDRKDKLAALKLAWSETPYTGVLYDIETPTLHELLDLIAAKAKKAGPDTVEGLLQEFA